MTREEIEAQLKPCPFCGGAAELVDEERTFAHDERATCYLVGCADCDALMGNFKDFETPAEVADEWNRRVDDLALAEEVTRLRAKRAELRTDHDKLLGEYSQRLAQLEAARRERDDFKGQAHRATVRASEYGDAFLACQANAAELRATAASDRDALAECTRERDESRAEVQRLRDLVAAVLQDMAELPMSQYAADYWQERAERLRAALGA